MPNFFKRCQQLHYSIRLPLIFSLMLATATAMAGQADVIKSNSLLIRDVFVVSAEAQVSASPLNVLIEDGRIKAIGTAEYPAATILEGHRQYLIPGLIDAHVHLDGVPGVMPGREIDSATYQQALAQIPRSYLYFGFTTLLDLASTADSIAHWNSQSLAPHAYFCTPALTAGGYPMVLMPEEMKQSATRHLLHDHYSHPDIAQSGQSSPEEIVAKAKAQNARCVKVFYETGFGPMRNLPVPSQDIIRDVVDAAHDHSLPVLLHSNSASAYEFGLATGVGMMVHGLWNTEDRTAQQLAKIAERIANANIAVQPTIQVLVGERELLNPDFFNQPNSQAAIPPALLAWYQTKTGQWMANVISEGLGTSKNMTAAERYQQAQNVYAPIIDNAMKFSRQLRTQGAHLVFGSDTPSGPIYTQFPGLNGRLEIQRWHELGIDPPEIFRALTINNAQVLGLERDLGSVEKSKLADLLILAENPLTSVDAYDSIQWVILRGTPIKRDSLSALKFPSH